MKIFRHIEEFPSHLRGGALSIGNFDGVHLGHAHLLSRLVKCASDLEGPATVLTFDPHPARILNPERAPVPLTWPNRKAELLGREGVDVMIALPTGPELLNLSYRKFFDQFVVGNLGARAMVEGPNFFFGRNRAGNVDKLRELCQAANIELAIVQPIKQGDDFISSSRVREAIRRGQVDLACELLTQPYRLRGTVTHGAGRGQDLGFPTANLDAVDTLVPARGVYAGRAILEGTTRWAAIHIGPSPTFGDHVDKIEVHVLDFDAAIYGQVMEAEFLKQIRPGEKFSSPEELIEQMRRDIDVTRRIATEYSAKAS